MKKDVCETNQDEYRKILSDNNEILGSHEEPNQSDQYPDEKHEINDGYLYQNDSKALSDRGFLYTSLLQEYITFYHIRHNANSKYKLAFFVIVMAVFILVILGSVAVLIILVVTKASNINTITLCATSFGTILSSFIILPRIIAEYLFPSNEDEKVADMAKNMQQNDSETRKQLHNEIHS